ncbi:MAG: hypothetical protein A2W74_10070 [Planctomycetes bacterium RIFCSPLOWO2_12_38_17]|nr:MAG: hypothetical protein A2W74_10070 [Planctomycetes bacterium RIFCSPLOWO2_12_38_17]
MRYPVDVEDKHVSEETFHDKWAKEINPSELLVYETFESITAVENKYALSTFGDIAGKALLDLGCGAGETSVYFALKGAKVTAVDISAEMLKITEKLSNQYGVNVITIRSVVEKLEFPNSSFDYVFGNGVLHHVQLNQSIKEIKRVLKPNGKAIFVEPLNHNPLIHVYRILAKNVRTPTEHPFEFKDFKLVKKHFGRVTHREFWLFSLLIFVIFLCKGAHPSRERYWKKIIVEGEKYKKSYTFLKKIDDFILKLFPFLGRFCWNTVIVLENNFQHK